MKSAHKKKARLGPQERPLARLADGHQPRSRVGTPSSVERKPTKKGKKAKKEEKLRLAFAGAIGVENFLWKLRDKRQSGEMEPGLSNP